MDILIPTYPINSEKRIDIESKINKFLTIWNLKETLKKEWLPTGKGTPEDIYSLDYVIYEGLFSLFVANATEFIDLGVAILGNTLVNLLKFEWCFIKYEDSHTIALQNSYNNMRVPIREMIIHRLSSNPQFDSHEHLFFDILLSSDSWQNGYHPLLECNLEDWVDDFDFKATYGYSVPVDIKKEVELFLYQDTSFFIRQIGLEGYDLPNKQDWGGLRSSLYQLNILFNKVFGKDWKTRCLKAINF